MDGRATDATLTLADPFDLASYGSVELTYTPNGSFFGSDSFTYRANDGTVDSPLATVSITVAPLSATKFYVVDASVDGTFEYDASGNPLPADTWNLASGNTAPKGATANVAGDKVWVVDKNKTVYVYDGNAGTLGSWNAAGLNRPEGIATDGTDVWILDKRNKRVYRYGNAAGLTSGPGVRRVHCLLAGR